MEEEPRENLPPKEESQSFSQEGGENVVFDKTSADERMEAIEREQVEHDEALTKKYEERPDLLEQLRSDLKQESDPRQKEESRELLIRNISLAFKETMEESQTMLEMNPGSLYSIFSKADEKQIEYWVLQLLAGYQDVDEKEQNRRVSALKGLGGLVNQKYFDAVTSRYLPELKIDLGLETRRASPTPPVQTQHASWWRRLFGDK